MPFKTDKHNIESPFLDKRCKMLPCQKERMIRLNQEGMSQRKLASMFNVSRRLVQFILDPEKQKKNVEVREARGGSMQYYDKQKHTDSMRKYRRRKYQILKDSV